MYSIFLRIPFIFTQYTRGRVSHVRLVVGFLVVGFLVVPTWLWGSWLYPPGCGVPGYTHLVVGFLVAGFRVAGFLVPVVPTCWVLKSVIFGTQSVDTCVDMILLLAQGVDAGWCACG